MNIFKEAFHSLWDFKSYQKFLGNRKLKVFLYGAVISILFFLITVIFPLVKFQVSTGGFEKILEDYVPEFELSGDMFQLEEPIHFEGEGLYVDIDTSPDQPLYDFDDPAVQSIMKKYESVLMADYEKVYFKNKGQVNQIMFEDLTDGGTYTRDSLKQFIPMINGIIAAVVVFVFLFGIAGFFLGALVISVVGLIINSSMKTALSFGKLFLLSVYTRTLPVALKALLGVVGIHIPFLWLISFVISGVYLYMVLSKIREAQREPVVVDVTEDQTV